MEPTTTPDPIDEEETQEIPSKRHKTVQNDEFDMSDNSSSSSSSSSSKKGATTDAKSPELLSIPKNAIKRIMKLDDDVKQVQQEAVLLVGKATELFIARLAQKAYSHAHSVQGTAVKQIKYDNIVKARLEDANMLFLKRKFQRCDT